MSVTEGQDETKPVLGSFSFFTRLISEQPDSPQILHGAPTVVVEPDSASCVRPLDSGLGGQRAFLIPGAQFCNWHVVGSEIQGSNKLFKLTAREKEVTSWR